MAMAMATPRPPRAGDRPGPLRMIRGQARRPGTFEAIEPRAIAGAFDWQEVREGAREVFLTLAATIALGLGWAALEASWAEAARSPVDGASAFGTGYASLDPTAR